LIRSCSSLVNATNTLLFTSNSLDAVGGWLVGGFGFVITPHSGQFRQRRLGAILEVRGEILGRGLDILRGRADGIRRTPRVGWAILRGDGWRKGRLGGFRRRDGGWRHAEDIALLRGDLAATGRDRQHITLWRFLDRSALDGCGLDGRSRLRLHLKGWRLFDRGSDGCRCRGVFGCQRHQGH
jgi:hypothetical protein